MCSPQKDNSHWLDRYATAYHTWKQSTNSNGTITFHRPLGLVETSFDSDGSYYGGRADMTATLTCELSHSLPEPDLRRRIALAWTNLRLRHVLLQARHFDDEETGDRCFAVDVPRSLEEALGQVQDSMVWIADHYAEVDEVELHDHALNVGRIIEPQKCMSKLHVLPLRQLPAGTFQLRFLVVMAHEISDGLSAYGWFKDLLRILNLPLSELETEITASLNSEAVRAKLPPAQEDLYPRIAGSRARQRWIWAIIRVLRHVKKPLPPSFVNPLYRPRRLEGAITLPPTYASIFSYDKDGLPPMSSGYITATLSAAASARLISLCRAAHCSVGSGCFALAGLTMMDLYSRLPSSKTSTTTTPTPPPAMTASFPLNPRAFFSPAPSAESCMLSFSDGIVMPFLPSSSSSPKMTPTTRLLRTTKHANRQLRTYQKRLPPRAQKKSTVVVRGAGMDNHSPARLLATGYVLQFQRVVANLALSRRNKSGFFSCSDPQGSLGASSAKQTATCGVSSVGSLKGYFRKGEYDLFDKERDFVVDYRGLKMGVRAREGEFLVGSWTDGEGRVGFGASYDACAIDGEAAERWKGVIEGFLEGEEEAEAEGKKREWKL